MKPDRGRWPTPDDTSPYAAALKVAIEAAQAAGARLRAELHRPGGPRGTGEHAPIDEEVEAEEIRPRLLEAFPNWGYRGEETRPHLPPQDRAAHVWLVDPNDATAAFLRGYRGAAVSVGLLRDGLPVLGVLFAYAYPDDEGDLLTWAEGEPLRRNGATIERTVEDRPLRRDDVVLVSESADRNPVANALCVAPARFFAVPSIAYRLGLSAVGEGRAAVSLSGPGDWDYAAGHALLRAVGGELLDGDGHAIWYTREGVSTAYKGWCFGGDPAAIQQLWQRDWPSVMQPSTSSGRYPPLRPRPGQLASDSSVLARAQGCLLGQLAGDALGSLVEFQSVSQIQRDYPNGVRDMVDGGIWNTLAGQPTDDSELALMLAHSLLHAGRYDPDAAAAAYGYWLETHPFDIGNTTRQALSAVVRAGGQAEAGRQAANPQSQANGSLMRCAPLAIWGYRLDPDELADYARADSLLTHPHPVCQDSVAAFCIAIAHAILNGGSAENHYQAALDWADPNAQPTVLAALRAAAEPAERQPPIDGAHQGWVLYALQNAFHQLLHAPSLEEGLVRTVAQGGDTDTTAAIAGALLGAHHGRAAIPDRWRRTILTCRPLPEFGARNPRPHPLWPVDALYVAEALLDAGSNAAGGS